jgi:D-alanyl-D-alanine carboxypeptidase (penicillin-binding protein 5/6)
MKRIRFLVRLLLVFGFFYLVWISASYLSNHFLTGTLPNSPVAKNISPVSDNSEVPSVSAKYIFILDRRSKTVLYQKKADEQIYPASTTKMMTAIVTYEQLPLDTSITVSHSYPEGVDIELQPGETLRVSDLLYAILVPSANDAAEVLAEGFPGGRSAFIQAMNNKAVALNLKNTHFLNPTGLDEVGHYSSAADLARIADHLLGSEYLAKIVSTENAVVSSSDLSVYHSLSNVNELLGKVSGVVGIKTGFTDLAGESLITLVNRDGREVIISLLGSTDRFSDTEKLIEWIYSSFTWPQL